MSRFSSKQVRCNLVTEVTTDACSCTKGSAKWQAAPTLPGIRANSIQLFKQPQKKGDTGEPKGSPVPPFFAEYFFFLVKERWRGYSTVSRWSSGGRGGSTSGGGGLEIDLGGGGPEVHLLGKVEKVQIQLPHLEGGPKVSGPCFHHMRPKLHHRLAQTPRGG